MTETKKPRKAPKKGIVRVLRLTESEDWQPCVDVKMARRAVERDGEPGVNYAIVTVHDIVTPVVEVKEKRRLQEVVS